jgi:SET domain-containing protein
MVLGYGMMYNHQDTPNTKWKFDYSRFVADVIAEHKILAGEEIFVSYGSKYFQNRKKIDYDYAKDNK